jgi:hypothetical protein
MDISLTISTKTATPNKFVGRLTNIKDSKGSEKCLEDKRRKITQVGW